MRKQIFDGLSKPAGEKSISTMMLYDDKGLQLFDKITDLKDYYYLTASEQEILENKAEEIVAYVNDGAVLVELGAG